jgi:hypothetical protein
MVFAGARRIAERVVGGLEAADPAIAALPSQVADTVLVALGSSTAEREDLARTLARQFRMDVTTAVESSVHRALQGLGHPQGLPVLAQRAVRRETAAESPRPIRSRAALASRAGVRPARPVTTRSG